MSTEAQHEALKASEEVGEASATGAPPPLGPSGHMSLMPGSSVNPVRPVSARSLSVPNT